MPLGQERNAIMDVLRGLVMGHGSFSAAQTGDICGFNQRKGPNRTKN